MTDLAVRFTYAYFFLLSRMDINRPPKSLERIVIKLRFLCVDSYYVPLNFHCISLLYKAAPGAHESPMRLTSAINLLLEMG